MAPMDRHERRQQRVRGAGAPTVQGNFGFAFPTFGSKPAKQSSLPTQSSRRTPTPSLKTPRGANGSTKRHRSASVQRSSSVKRHITPRERTVTPHLGKRKRGSKQAQASEDDGEVDDLSPDRDDEVRSIERSRKVAGTVSPIREEVDDMPDELSILEEGVSSIKKPAVDASIAAGGTPTLPPSKPRVSLGGAQEKTPIADRIGAMSITSRTTIVRRRKSTEPPSVTPGMLPNGRPRVSSASHFGPDFMTPGATQNGEDSEDELTPPQINAATPRIVGTDQPQKPTVQENGEMELDELSSPAQSSLLEQTPQLQQPKKSKQQQKPTKQKPEQPSVAAPPPAKRGRPKRVVMDEEDEVQATPAATKPRRKNISLGTQEEVEADDAPDEISPEVDRTQRPPKVVHRMEEPDEVSSGEESDDYEPEQEEETTTRAPRPAPKQKSAGDASGEPPRKRPKFAGPKQAISVMRIKGSTVRGITVADTTRTILEQNLDHQVSRMAEKMQKVQDSARRKQIRGELNLALAFKESLNEKLLDLQDANDTLSAGFKKRRVLKSGNIKRRKEILTLQNSRQEIALEMDDEQALFDAEKEKVEAKNKLSANMFEIQAAIQSGRERARKEGREDEGPEMPLAMLLDIVGKEVGSIGGGLLATLQEFNGGLERAAGWLEGRA